jgi:hypothetical protein
MRWCCFSIAQTQTSHQTLELEGAGRRSASHSFIAQFPKRFRRLQAGSRHNNYKSLQCDSQFCGPR